ncbi:MAG: Ldh family oxidoreductase [Rhodospirillaceae bacterium]|nr:Ldh family oxidoreductase [Rhodospirillaceae bacterium]
MANSQDIAQDGGIRVPADVLRQLVSNTFAAAGCSADEAGRIGSYLTASNLSGHESHGVLRVPRYLHWLNEGNITRDQTITIDNDNDVLAVVDGNFGFGQTIGPQAVRLGMEKARKNGVALIGLRNSGHLGRIGDWAEMAAADGLISIHFVNTSGLGLLVAPFGGAERRMSTNPVCIGIPNAEGDSLILDFATSIVAEGKVLNAHGGGKPLPEGALIDGDGTLSTDPVLIYGASDSSHPLDVRTGTGAIRAMGEHKGSGLSFMCEILAGALTGSGCSRPGVKQLANGMLSIYVAPEFLNSEAGFAAELRDYVAFFRSANPAEVGGEVLCPGDAEKRNRVERLAEGVPLPSSTWQSLLSAAADVGMPSAVIETARDAAVDC